jgi:hypothetical protein
MKPSRLYSLAGLLSLAASSAPAAGGLVAKAPDTLWLGLTPRVTLQTQALTPWWLARLGDGPAAGPALRTVQSGSLVGDYYFAQPAYGRFRASGGLWINQPAGGAEGWSPAPYLGLGYSSPARWAGFSFSADLGVAAESAPSTAGGLGRALLGVQGAESSRRELRLSPVLQLGVRYAF